MRKFTITNSQAQDQLTNQNDEYNTNKEREDTLRGKTRTLSTTSSESN